LEIGSPYVRLNYDAGNTVSHRPGQVDPAKDALVALPGCGHIHLKDVEARNGGYYFVPIGEGDVDCSMILQSIKNRPDLNLAIETPLRFHRNRAANPAETIPLLRFPSLNPFSANHSSLSGSNWFDLVRPKSRSKSARRLRTTG